MDLFVDKALSKQTEVFHGSDLGGVVDVMSTRVKGQIENPALPRSGFSVYDIIYLDVDFHKLILTREARILFYLSGLQVKRLLLPQLMRVMKDVYAGCYCSITS